MPVIQHTNKVHEAACVAAEGQRQSALAAANTPALCKAADIAFYRAVIASCKTNGQPYGNFVETLQFLGTGGL